MNSATLYYIHDPMCSWCWGFEKTWHQVKQSLPKSITVQYVLGGLAPDSHQAMSDEMRQYIQKNWLKIQQEIPGTDFNFDFWEKCSPMRSTYPACRAVIAAKNQDKKLEKTMINAIQNAYYLQAQNPSEPATLIQLAISIGLDQQQFIQDLNSSTTQKQLESDINLSKSLQSRGFPALIFSKNNVNYIINIDYNNSKAILEQILA